MTRVQGAMTGGRSRPPPVAVSLAPACANTLTSKKRGMRMRFGRPTIVAVLALAAAPVAAQSTAQPPAAPPPVIAPESGAEKGATAPDKARIELSGKIHLDFIQDFKRVDPSYNATLRPSRIPVRCPGDPGCGPDGESIFSIRQTALAFKAFVPTSAGEVRTELSMDLFASGGGNTQARVLNAWAELGSFGAGQFYSLFMNVDTFPNTIDYWGPNGMVFVRNPQMRWTPVSRDGTTVAFSIEAPNSAIDTGKVTLADPTLGIRGRTKLPDLVGKLGQAGDWGQVTIAGILRSIGYETTTTPDFEPSGTRTGWGVNLNGFWNVFGKDRLIGQLVYGEGIASYVNDGGVDLAPDAGLRAETVKSAAWFVWYDHWWSERWSSAVGYSEHKQDPLAGQFANAFRKGNYSSVNLLWYPAKNVTIGGELLWGRHEQKDGANNDDVRLQLSTIWKF
jgi:hypothetical protein